MTLTAVTDILFRDVPNAMRLREAVACAFDVPLPLVNLRTIGDLAPVDPASRVQLIRHPASLPGDFHDWYSLNVAADLVDRVDPALDVVTHQLRTVVLSDADDDLNMTIHLPDGSGQVVRLMQDEHDAFRITPEIRQLIERASRESPGAEQALDDPGATAAHGRKAIAR